MFEHIYRHHRRYRITEGAEEIQMRRVAGYMFGYMKQKAPKGVSIDPQPERTLKIEEFALERIQSLHENEVELNLSDSGVHPYDLRTLLGAEERESLLDIELGYGHTHGSPVLREAIAGLYANRTADEVIVTTGGIEANFRSS